MTRVLLIARHYPPEVSGGARRPYLLAKGLRDLGYKVAVVSPFPTTHEDDIHVPHPAGVTSNNTRSDDDGKPGWMRTARAFIRRMVLWPDNDIRWAKRVFRTLRDTDGDIVITTSPSESSHYVGMKMRTRRGLPWLAEFRDSWISDPLKPETANSPFRRKGEAFIARRWLKHCDAIVAVSTSILEEMISFNPGLKDNAHMIGHFSTSARSTHRFDGSGPHYLHTGRFSKSHMKRSINMAIEAFTEQTSDQPDARFHLVGALTEDEIAVAEKYDKVIIHGVVPLETSLAMQSGADVLVLCQSGTRAIPGKLSEYRASNKPILYVGTGKWLEELGESLSYESAMDSYRGIIRRLYSEV